MVNFTIFIHFSQQSILLGAPDEMTGTLIEIP